MGWGRQREAPRAPDAVFSCSIVHEGGCTVAAVIGTIDRMSAGQFRNQLLTLAKEHPGSIVVDLADAELADEGGLVVLIEVWRFTQEHGIELTIRAATPPIRELFDVAPSGVLLTLR
jgi:anti-anti-sigma factor